MNKFHICIILWGDIMTEHDVNIQVETVVEEAVERIYKEGQKVGDAFNWAVDQIYEHHGKQGVGFHALTILNVMYPKLDRHEQKLLAMRIPCGDDMDW